MSVEILGKKLYAQDEVIKEVNTSVRTTEKALAPEMLAYYRDIVGIVPKPVRIRTSRKRGGAPSFYTKEALDSLKLITYENKINKKTLKDIIKEKGDILEDNRIKSDLFRNKYDYLVITKNKQGNDNIYIFEFKNKTPDKKAATEQVRQYLLAGLKKIADDLNDKVEQEKLDNLLDDLGALYYKSIQYRMEDWPNREGK